MDTDCVLITGGNSGIGFECARDLARRGWRVVIASRDKNASARAVETIGRESGPDSISAMELDLASPDRVRAFAAEFLRKDLPLKALVCNAGLQMNRDRKFSAEGYELTFAVNHLGHYLLTNLLVDKLRDAAPSRIVVTASGVHDPALKTGMPFPKYRDIEDIARTGGSPEDSYNGRLAYVNSKLCNVWFVYELARRLQAAGLSTPERPITVNGFDPGLVPGSGLARDYPAALQFLWHNVLPGVARVVSTFKPTINPAPKSGQALARLAFDPALEGVTGKYFPSHTRWAEAPSSEVSYDVDMAHRLWEWSAAATGVTLSGGA